MPKYRYLLIPYAILMYACQVDADAPTRGKWQVVKEVNKITDAKMDSTTVKISDFSYDLFNFKTTKELLITRNRETLRYEYSINDKVLRFMANGDTIHYGIQKVDKDSLVLYRKENWANTISISSTLYFKKVEK